MYTIEELFRDDAGAFQDVVTDALVSGAPESPEALREIFLRLPQGIQDEAHCWGLSDTVFKDNAYEWLEKHPEAVRGIR